MEIELGINKTNSFRIFSNSKICYVIGIGKTDYTIHREANGVAKDYKSNIFVDPSPKNLHTYHVMLHRFKTIVSDGKQREKFKHNGKLYRINNISIGLKGVTNCVLEKSYFGDKLIWVGKPISEINDKLKFIVTCDLLDQQ